MGDTTIVGETEQRQSRLRLMKVGNRIRIQVSVGDVDPVLIASFEEDEGAFRKKMRALYKKD